MENNVVRPTKCIAFCIAITNENTYILATKNGKTNKWSCPSLYIDVETGQECCSRAVYEQTGIEFESKYFDMFDISTNPLIDVNIVLKYALVYTDDTLPEINLATVHAYQEPHVIEEVKWMPVKTMNKKNWIDNQYKSVENLIDLILTNAHKKK